MKSGSCAESDFGVFYMQKEGIVQLIFQIILRQSRFLFQ